MPALFLKAFKFFAADPESALKITFYGILIPLILLAMIFAAPLALIEHIPLAKPDVHQVYIDVTRDIKNDKDVQIDYNYLLAIDAVLLEQDFSDVSESHVKSIANRFVLRKEVTRYDEDGDDYTVIVYELKSFDTVINELVEDEILSEDQIDDVKRYYEYASMDSTKVNMDDLPVVTNGSFMRPATGSITSGYGSRWGKLHAGVDIGGGGRSGVPVVAAADGVVKRSYRSTTYGECIIIGHNINGQYWETLYAHMVTGSRNFLAGDTVRKGDVIGTMGNTGASQGVHLHFELHLGGWTPDKGNSVNPVNYVQF